MGIHFCCLELNLIYGSAFGCIIGYLRGFLIQLTDRRLLTIRCRLQSVNIIFVCHRLLHGRIDSIQCGGHARAIADSPSHLQRTCSHGSHAVQLRTVIRELRGLRLQSGDVAFIRADTVSSGIQIILICFTSKRVIQIIPLSLQVIYGFHQSDGSITNRGFKSCYFPLYIPYASIQCCNRILICFAVQRFFCSKRGISSCRINFLVNSSFIISYIGSVCRDFLPMIHCRSLQSCDIVLVSLNGFLFTIFSQQIIHSRLGIYLSGARRRLIHMHDIYRTRYAQSPAEERKRHKSREKGTSSHPPNFFRAGSRLRVRASDFRCYHIAIFCLGPDDFVDVVHDDFPLCEKQ